MVVMMVIQNECNPKIGMKGAGCLRNVTRFSSACTNRASLRVDINDITFGRGKSMRSKAWY